MVVEGVDGNSETLTPKKDIKVDWDALPTMNEFEQRSTLISALRMYLSQIAPGLVKPQEALESMSTAELSYLSCPIALTAFLQKVTGGAGALPKSPTKKTSPKCFTTPQSKSTPLSYKWGSGKSKSNTMWKHRVVFWAMGKSKSSGVVASPRAIFSSAIQALSTFSQEM